MAASTRGKTASAVASAELVGAKCIVHGIYVMSAATLGSVVLKDGGASGTVKVTIPTPAAIGSQFIPLGPRGISFATDCYAVLTVADGVTIIYEDS